MNLFPGFGHKLHVLPHQMTILVDDVDIYHIINRALSKAVDLIVAFDEVERKHNFVA